TAYVDIAYGNPWRPFIPENRDRHATCGELGDGPFPIPLPSADETGAARQAIEVVWNGKGAVSRGVERIVDEEHFPASEAPHGLDRERFRRHEEVVFPQGPHELQGLVMALQH